MLKNLIKTTATAANLTQVKARQAVGIVLSAADSQGAPMAEKVFSRMPAARTLAADSARETGAGVGEIARLIEQTPGGRRYVSQRMFSRLHKVGLDHTQIAALLPAIGDYMRQTYQMDAVGHLGDLIVAEPGTATRATAVAA